MNEILANCGLPTLIQGGMGIGISGWKLARTVARRGHLGVVSGTAIDRVVACRLQEGDVGGDLRRAFEAFPNREVADRVYLRWHRPEGLAKPGGYRALSLFGVAPPAHLIELATLAGFAEVWLAKEERRGPIGINLLEKIQPPTLPVLYGALLAGVDYVLMGAGIPRDIPGHLDALVAHRSCALRLDIEDGSTEESPFDPSPFACQSLALSRPRFLAIISSNVLAMSLARSGGVDGFVIEGPTAGGHNARPRGWSPQRGGELVYGPKDEVDLARLASLGLPFWIAGGQNRAESLAAAQAAGAVGIQVGTPFAFCSESGMEPSLRLRTLAAVRERGVHTRTEGFGSPTGFPFKTLDLEGSEGGRSPADRVRQPCQHGYLRTAYRKENGEIGWRCAAEPEADYVAKGGDIADCKDKRCLCNGLMATVGHPYAMRSGGIELPLITSGEIQDVLRFLGSEEDYDADSVIDALGIADAPNS